LGGGGNKGASLLRVGRIGRLTVLPPLRLCALVAVERGFRPGMLMLVGRALALALPVAVRVDELTGRGVVVLVVVGRETGRAVAAARDIPGGSLAPPGLPGADTGAATASIPSSSRFKVREALL